MFCTVYQVRSQGFKREREAIRLSGRSGDLSFDCGLWDPRPARQVMRATLVDTDGERYLLPVLDRARLVKIRGSGLLITGIEVIPRGIGMKNIKADHYPQTWWCVPMPQVAHPAPADTGSDAAGKVETTVSPRDR